MIVIFFQKNNENIAFNEFIIIKKLFVGWVYTKDLV